MNENKNNPDVWDIFPFQKGDMRKQKIFKKLRILITGNKNQIIRAYYKNSKARKESYQHTVSLLTIINPN